MSQLLPPLGAVLPEALLAVSAIVLILIGALRGEGAASFVTGLAIAVLVAAGILVLVAPADSAKPVEITKSLDLLKLLGPDGKIATGLTDSVPVGIYAKTALTNLGMWDSVRERIVGAESVRAALALVERGEVPLGIVYATDAAITPKVKVVGVFPADTHPPVEYPFALLKGHDSAEAKAFFKFLVGPEAKEIYKKYGFSVK